MRSTCQDAGVTWALDLDGVVWLGDQPIPGAAAAIDRLRRRGERVLFLTNNSSLTVAEYLDKLHGHDVAAGADDLITSAQAAAQLVGPGQTVLVCAGEGVDEAIAARGASAVRDGRADAVVVGWHRDFDFHRLAAATTAVLGGARLIGTNDDATYPTRSGPLPGAGSILAAVAYASGATPVVAGKPNQPMADLIAVRAGEVAVMVGDRPSTDGLMARRLGARFGLVLSGITRRADLPVQPAPDVISDDLATLVADQASG